MKVNELSGALLALWVARAEGIEERENVKLYASGPCLYKESGHGGGEPYEYRPDSRHAHGGPILDREHISTLYMESVGEWRASHPRRRGKSCGGPTMLVAGMRAHVASKYGQDVPS